MSNASPEGQVSLLFGRKFLGALGIIATVTAVPSLLIGLPPIQNVLFNDAAEIEIDLNNEISIFDVNQKLDTLTVSFNGDDLTRTGQSLVSSRVRIVNVGGKSISSADIAPSDPLGFAVTGGHIIRISKYSASSTHLQKLSNPKQVGETVYINSGLIFDPQDYIDIDVLILKSNDKKLSYRPVGKVSGQSSINFSDKRTSKFYEGFFSTAFKGSFFVHLARLIVYTLISVFLLFVTAISWDKAQSIRKKRKARALEAASAQVYEHLAGCNPVAQAYVVGVFSTFGYKSMEGFYSVLKSDYDVKPSPEEFKQVADLHIATVKAKPSSIRKYLESSYSSSYDAINLAQEFNLMGHEWVSPEFISAFDSMMNYFADRKLHNLTVEPWIEARFDAERIYSPKRKLKPSTIEKTNY